MTMISFSMFKLYETGQISDLMYHEGKTTFTPTEMSSDVMENAGYWNHQCKINEYCNSILKSKV